MAWEPMEKTRKVLDLSIEIAQGVPYTPTARYVFYRIYQALGLKKTDYKNFLKLTSRARKEYYGDWRPDTLADGGRTVLGAFDGYQDLEDWFEWAKSRRPKMAPIFQDNLVYIGFEADAMKGQFEHYLGVYGMPLLAFRGDPSIPFKWTISQMIKTDLAKYPGKTVYFLYFGDYDPKGLSIPEHAMEDISKWAGVPIKFVRLGLNTEHIEKYDIPDHLEKPGQYQWEAIPDAAAGEIMAQVFTYWSKEAHSRTNVVQDRVAAIYTREVSGAMDQATKEALKDPELAAFFPNADRDDDDEDDQGVCYNCNEALDHDDPDTTCLDCGADLCPDCSEQCDDCGAVLCPSCKSEQGGVCEDCKEGRANADDDQGADQ